MLACGDHYFNEGNMAPARAELAPATEPNCRSRLSHHRWDCSDLKTTKKKKKNAKRCSRSALTFALHNPLLAHVDSMKSQHLSLPGCWKCHACLRSLYLHESWVCQKGSALRSELNFLVCQPSRQTNHSAVFRHVQIFQQKWKKWYMTWCGPI